MALTRSATGQLVEQESLQDRVQRIAGSGSLPPTSPYAAAATGASLDQAKMAGTPAQKEAVLQEQVAKEETLAGSQRLDQASGIQATGAQQQAHQQAQQLKSVGSLSGRMQSLIEQKLAQGTAQVGKLIVDQDALKLATGLDETDPVFTQLLDKVTAFSQNPSEENLVAIQQLTDVDGDPVLDIESVNDMTNQFLSKDETVAQQFSSAVLEQGKQITLGDLEPSELGYANWGELATAAGIDASEVEGLTVEDLQKRVGELQDRQFSRMESLQARIAATPPGSARRRILERQLQEIQQAGVLGTETIVAETTEDLELADEVKIGDNTFNIEELFEEESLSDMISAYLAAPDSQKDALLPPEIFGDLTSWIDRNSLALADLTDTVVETEETWEQAQDDWAQATQVTDNVSLDPDVMESLFGYNGDKVVTSTEMATLKSIIEGSEIGKLAADEEYEFRDELLSSLTADNVNTLMSDGSLIPMAQIKSAYETGQELLDADIVAISGVEPNEFITDAQQQSLVQNAKAVDEALDLLPDNVANRTEWLASESFLNLSPENKLSLAENPDRFADFQRYEEMAKQVSQIDSFDEAISHVFGDAMTPKLLSSTYDKVFAQANAGYPAAKKTLKLFKQAFGGSGKPTEAALNHMLSKLNGELSKTTLDSIASGNSGSFGQWNELLSKNTDSFNNFSNLDAKLPIEGRGIAPNEFYDTISKFTTDGSVSGGDFTNIAKDLFSKTTFGHDGTIDSKASPGYGGINWDAVAVAFDGLNHSDASKGPGYPRSWEEAKDLMLKPILNEEATSVLKGFGVSMKQLDKQLSSGTPDRNVFTSDLLKEVEGMRDKKGIPSEVKKYYAELAWKIYKARGKIGVVK